LREVRHGFFVRGLCPRKNGGQPNALLAAVSIDVPPGHRWPPTP